MDDFSQFSDSSFPSDFPKVSDISIPTKQESSLSLKSKITISVVASLVGIIGIVLGLVFGLRHNSKATQNKYICKQGLSVIDEINGISTDPNVCYSCNPTTLKCDRGHTGTTESKCSGNCVVALTKSKPLWSCNNIGTCSQGDGGSLSHLQCSASCFPPSETVLNKGVFPYPDDLFGDLIEFNVVSNRFYSAISGDQIIQYALTYNDSKHDIEFEYLRIINVKPSVSKLISSYDFKNKETVIVAARPDNTYELWGDEGTGGTASVRHESNTPSTTLYLTGYTPEGKGFPELVTFDNKTNTTTSGLVNAGDSFSSDTAIHHTNPPESQINSITGSSSIAVTTDGKNVKAGRVYGTEFGNGTSAFIDLKGNGVKIAMSGFDTPVSIEPITARQVCITASGSNFSIYNLYQPSNSPGNVVSKGRIDHNIGDSLNIVNCAITKDAKYFAYAVEHLYNSVAIVVHKSVGSAIGNTIVLHPPDNASMDQGIGDKLFIYQLSVNPGRIGVIASTKNKEVLWWVIDESRID
jgi:hypothetical protein